MYVRLGHYSPPLPLITALRRSFPTPQPDIHCEALCLQTITYPDGEVVTYQYNAAGQVERLTSNKQGHQSVIVDRIGYDKEGHTV